MNRMPLEDHIDLLLAFAPLRPDIASYEEKARLLGLAVTRNDVAPEYRLIKTDGFGLMLVDGHVARVHGVGLFDEPSDGTETALGVGVATTADEMSVSYSRLRVLLEQRLGCPAREGTWSGSSVVEDDRLVEYAYASWTLSDSILVLLHNDEGDAHIGEWATVDVRIAPAAYESALPASIKEVFGWPIEY